MSGASPRWENLLIRASAGTGKTFQLASRYLGLALDGVLVERILAATFARKAAGEILERIVTWLANAADDEPTRRALAAQVQRPLAADDCRRVLRELVAGLHRLRVGTLDSFFHQMARGFTLELGLPPAWQLIDEIDERRLREAAVQSVLEDGTSGDLLTLLHLLAKGATSRSVAQQIWDVVAAGYPTYLDSAEEAWQALPRRSALDAPQLAAAVQSLVDCGELAGEGKARTAHQASVEQAQAGDWVGFISKGIAQKVAQGESTYARKPIPPALVEAYQPLVRHAQAVVVNQLAGQTEATWRVLDRFHAAYQRHKTVARALRFDDVTRTLAAGLISLDQGQLAHRLDGEVAHLLLDEFQDTSLAQWNVLQPLAQSVAGRGERSLLCVGDVKQAIYAWRGGESEIFEALHLALEGVSERPLDQSFRCGPVVIEVVNRVFGSLAGNPALRDYPAVAAAWNRRFQPHTAARGKLPGHCTLETAPAATGPQEQRAATLDYAAARVAELARAAPGRTIGVLTRTNDSIARLIYELSTRHHIRASEEGGNPLDDSPAVEWILSALTLADHPDDGVARFHLAHSPLADALGLVRHDDDAAAFDAARVTRAALLAEGYGRVVYGWVRSLAPWCDERNAGRLAQLCELAYAYDDRATSRPTDFVRYVRETTVADPSSAQVRVMTVHQAKGLEFDIVVLPELDRRMVRTPSLVYDRPSPLAPIQRVMRYAGKEVQNVLPPEFAALCQRANDRSVNELLCVLYVAMTRAVHALHLIVAPASSERAELPRNLAGLLRQALADGRAAAPQTTLYEHGERNWLRSAGAAPDAPAAQAPLAAEPLIVRLGPDGAAGRRGLEHLSPSGMEGGTRVDLSLRLRDAAPIGRRRGTLLHKWFEQVAWLDERPPTAEQLRQATRELLLPGIDLAAELAAFERMLAQPELRRALSRASYQDLAGLGFSAAAVRTLGARPQIALYRERRVAVRLHGALLSGAVDRLVVLSADGGPVAADVLDFKSDDVSDPARRAARIAFYRPQLAAYREAVARLLRIPAENVLTRLLWTGTGEVSAVEP